MCGVFSNKQKKTKQKKPTVCRSLAGINEFKFLIFFFKKKIKINQVIYFSHHKKKKKNSCKEPFLNIHGDERRRRRARYVISEIKDV